jgi:hypothetical protein
MLECPLSAVLVSSKVNAMLPKLWQQETSSIEAHLLAAIRISLCLTLNWYGLVLN